MKEQKGNYRVAGGVFQWNSLLKARENGRENAKGRHSIENSYSSKKEVTKCKSSRTCDKRVNALDKHRKSHRDNSLLKGLMEECKAEHRRKRA